MSLDVNSADRDGWSVVTASGDLDSETAEEFQEAVERQLDAGYARTVLDLAGVEFCDSSGLRALMILSRLATERGHTLTLARPSSAVRLVLEASGLTPYLPVEATLPTTGDIPR